MSSRAGQRGVSAQLLGIDVRLDPSWGILAALIAALLALSVFPGMVEGARPPTLWAMAIVTVAGVGLSIVLHEMGHTLAARAFGIEVRSITLFLFGGVASLEKEAETPGQEFLIAIAGPIVSLVLAALFGGLAVAGPLPMPVATVLSYLALFNLVIAVFNMLPAFPLDGGRVLKAAIWRLRGDPAVATRVAARMGEILAFVLMGLGFLSLIGGAFGGLWWIAIGFYLFTIARASRRDAQAGLMLRGMVAADIMTERPVTVDAEAPVAWFVEELLARHPHDLVPVMAEGQVIGGAGLADAMRHPRADWPRLAVGDIMRPLAEIPVARPDDDLLESIRAMQRRGKSRMLVIGPQGLAGILTMKDVLAHLGFRQRLGG